MPSPFPGMDPWLEQHWGDVHTRIVTYASDRLQSLLPRELRARVEERVVLEDEGVRGRKSIPDIGIVEHHRPRPRRDSEEGGTATLVADELSVTVTELDETFTERFIEIRDYSTGGRLITVIEVLSPSNKRDPLSRKLYLKKRSELDQAGVHLVEIDLLRAAPHLDRLPKGDHPEVAESPCLVTVTRHNPDDGSRHIGMYGAPLRQRLPVVSIPLRPADNDVLLDVQAVLNDAYERGGYDILDYSQPPQWPLSSAEAEWAAVVVADRVRSQQEP